MKSFFILLLLMVIAPFCFCQNTGTHDFVGVLTTSDGQVINFKLILKEIKEGTFKGYSITNYEGADYTKSVIEGELNLKEKKMSFKEVSNTETKSSAEDSTFCYINASNLTIENSGKKNIVKGKFTGLFPSGKTCATGAIALVYNGIIEDMVKSEPKNSETASTNLVAKDSTAADSVFTSNEVLLINEWKNGLAIEVWDGDIQDNDEIAIYLNDKLIRAKVVLIHHKTIIHLPTAEDKFKLKIVALNEGRSGKNTLSFRLRNAGTMKDYVSMLNKGESFVIDFKKDNQ